MPEVLNRRLFRMACVEVLVGSWWLGLPAAEPYLVKDISATGSPSSFPQLIAPLEGRFLFSASGGTEFPDGTYPSFEVFVSDGTPEGTIPFRGRLGQVRSWRAEPWGPFAVEAGGKVYFAAREGVEEPEVWVSDWTPGGTRPLRELLSPGPDWRPTLGQSPAGELRVTASGNKLFLAASDAVHGGELWITDETSEGTRLVADIVPGPEGSDPDDLTACGALVFFTARYPEYDRELWVTDGSPEGTRLLKDINPGPESSYPGTLVCAGGRLFFSADGERARQLWVSDGTPEGTKLLKDIWWSPWGQERLTNLEALGDKVLFAGADPEHGITLWASDGTPEGTGIVKESSPANGGSWPQVLTRTGERIFYFAEGISFDLWISDGTPEGTRVVKENVPQSWTAAAVGNRFFFSGADPDHGMELWTSDGTSEGTHLFKDLNPATRWAHPGDLTALGGRLFFNANDGKGNGLWATNGSSDGTMFLADILRGTGSPVHSRLIAAGGRLFFTALWELWTSDGTAEGTMLLKDVNPLSLFTPVGERLFFVAIVEGNLSLWVSDGTRDGTVPVTGLDASIFTDAPPVAVGDRLFFGSGGALWVSDGTREGTIRLKDGVPTGDGTHRRWLAPVGQRLFFVVEDSNSIWSTDGSLEGTAHRLDSPSGSLDALSGLGDRLFFEAHDSELGGSALFITDGTREGTVKLLENCPGGCARHDWRPDAVGRADRFYFLADEGVHGPEIWLSDGTPQGTALLMDLRPGPEGSVTPFPYNFTGRYPLLLLGERLFFAADDGETGLRLWTSNGTPQGTVPIVGSGQSDYSSLYRRCVGKGECVFGVFEFPELLVAGETLYFPAIDRLHGAELWALPLGDYLRPRFSRGDANADGMTDIADAITTLGLLFLGSPQGLECEKSADVNDDGLVDVSDAVTLLSYLFQGGDPPPTPHPECGVDPTEDGLGCETGLRCL